jgi:translation elongation factor EF-Tu-like GTPase
MRYEFCLVLSLAAAIGCSGKPQMSNPMTKGSDFDFTVQEVFYIKPPVDRVILVGIVSRGSVGAGESLTVQCRGGDVPVVLEGIELFEGGEARQASAGQQVGLKLKGIRKDQPSRGDHVIRHPA